MTIATTQPSDAEAEQHLDEAAGAEAVHLRPRAGCRRAAVGRVGGAARLLDGGAACRVPALMPLAPR